MSRTKGPSLGPLVLLACAGLVAGVMALVMADLLTRTAAAEPTGPQPVYAVTPLGASGGASIARDINDSGQVVGQSNASGQNRAFLWEDCQMKDLGALGGTTTSAARGIDDSGRVVGFSRNSTNNLRGFLAQNGQPMTSDDELPPLAGFSSSEAWHISDSEVNPDSWVAVGRSFNSGTQGRAVLWEDGQTSNPTDLGESLKTAYSETAYSEAWSINNLGQVVGEVGKGDGQAKAFLYDTAKDDTDPDKVTDIDAAGRQGPGDPVFPYQYSEAAGINDQGQVVGWSYRTYTPSPEGKAFLYEKGEDGTARVLPLNPLDGDLYSRARDIDQSGRVVGFSRGTSGDDAAQFSAALWEDGKVTDLNDLIPAESRWKLTDPYDKSGWKLTDPYAINKSGRIVGTGYYYDKNGTKGQLRAFLLTPEDATKPTTTAASSPQPNSADWNDSETTVTLSATDEDGGSCVDKITYSTSGAQTIEQKDASGSSVEVKLDQEGTTTLTYYATDYAGNVEAPKTLTVKIDKSTPTISDLGPTTQPNANGWYNTDVVNRFEASDSGSGLNSACTTAFPDQAGHNVQSKTTTGEGTDRKVTSDGCADVAGNSTGGIDSATFKVDKTAIPSKASANAFNNAQTITVHYDTTNASSDLSGLKKVELWAKAPGESGYTMVDDSKTAASDDFSYNVTKGDGTYSFYTIAEDNAGNREVQPPSADAIVNVTQDTVAPTLTVTHTADGQNGWNTSSPVSVSITDSDSGSGLAGAPDCKDGTTTLTLTEGTAGNWTASVSGDGTHIISCSVSDNANNTTTTPDTVNIDTHGPMITDLGPTAAANSKGWYKTDVTNTFEAADSGSGLSSACTTAFPLNAGENVQSKTTSGEGSAVKVTSDSCIDLAGNTATGIDSATFKIDKSAPSVSCTIPSKLRTSANNHKLVDITASVTVSDSLSGDGGFKLDSVTSSQPDSGLGPDDEPNDIQGWTTGINDTSGQLRAERYGAERIYTLTYLAYDLAGNTAECKPTVTVPKGG